MDARGVPCAPINDYGQILSDPHIAALGLLRPLDLPNGVRTRTTAFPVSLSDYTFDVYRMPPALGAHTREVYEDWLGGDDAATTRMTVSTRGR